MNGGGGANVASPGDVLQFPAQNPFAMFNGCASPGAWRACDGSLGDGIEGGASPEAVAMLWYGSLGEGDREKYSILLIPGIRPISYHSCPREA